ncbi:MAG TPA: GNAT family N-acetyltransferase [Candidatus Limnocylindrales bacterium]
MSGGIRGIHHVQLAIPRGTEDEARGFWASTLGFEEIDKPPVLAARGGCWFRSGHAEVHLGVEDPFRPSAKAHPGLTVGDIGPLMARLREAGVEVVEDDAFPGYDRFYCLDPFGNRLEFLAPVQHAEAAPSARPRARAVRSSIRAATPDDLPAIRPILAAHGNDGSVVTGDVVGPYVLHVIEHHVALVSELDGEVVAYGASVDAGVAVHLADLFVRADRLGRGIGRPLLAAVLGDATRRTTIASEDPRAIPLYVRAGMGPRWTLLNLEGDASGLPDVDPALSVEAGDAETLAALEREWTGFDRLEDHRHWASRPEADPFVIVARGEPVAFGHARVRQGSPLRVLDRLRLRPDAEPVGPVLVAVTRASAGGPVTVSLPGPHPALPVLLNAGLRIVDRNEFMASDASLVDPLRLLPDGGLL